MVIKPIVEWKNPYIRKTFYFLFLPVSLLFGCLVDIRNKLYEFRILWTRHYDTFVIGVGSLSVGGTGKTPFVEFLAQYLAERGIRTGVLSSGYGKKSKGTILVSDGDKLLVDVQTAGDEAYLMAINFLKQNRRIPVISGSDRPEGIRILKNQFRCAAVILDDAFQYRKIRVSLSVIVQDFLELSYPLTVLPSGRLREFKRNMKRADFVVVSKAPYGTVAAPGDWHRKVLVTQYLPTALQSCFDNTPLPLEFLNGKKIILFSALGYNGSFKNCIHNLCLRHAATIEHFIEFQDHRWYRKKDIQKICSRIPSERLNDYVLLTTQKDAVKLKRSWVSENMIQRFFFIQSEFSFQPQIQFENLIKMSQIRANNDSI